MKFEELSQDRLLFGSQHYGYHTQYDTIVIENEPMRQFRYIIDLPYGVPQAVSPYVYGLGADRRIVPSLLPDGTFEDLVFVFGNMSAAECSECVVAWEYYKRQHEPPVRAEHRPAWFQFILEELDPTGVVVSSYRVSVKRVAEAFISGHIPIGMVGYNPIYGVTVRFEVEFIEFIQ